MSLAKSQYQKDSQLIDSHHKRMLAYYNTPAFHSTYSAASAWSDRNPSGIDRDK